MNERDFQDVDASPLSTALLSLMCQLFSLCSHSLLSTVSHSYGYGLLDAGAIVSLAKTWKNVAPQRKCVIPMVSEPRFVHSALRDTHTHGRKRFQQVDSSEDLVSKSLHFHSCFKGTS